MSAEDDKDRNPRLALQDKVWRSAGTADVKAVFQALMSYCGDGCRQGEMPVVDL